MKLMNRNLRPVYYCLYKGMTSLLDADGYETGEPSVQYDKPQKLMCNESPATGRAQLYMFGNLESVDKVLITDDMSCPIDENTVLFVDSKPGYRQGKPAYDYVVKRVARSLNSISIAISKVKVS